MIGKGPWKCYVVARCEMTKPKGAAFILGIHDPQRNNFAAYSRIDASRVADGEYHTFAIPMDELRPHMYFWLSPAGNPNIKHIYVDRIFFIKADGIAK